MFQFLLIKKHFKYYISQSINNIFMIGLKYSTILDMDQQEDYYNDDRYCGYVDSRSY